MKTEENAQKLNPEHIVQINGKKFVRYAGLLDLAERKGLKSLDVELIQVPAESNGFYAIAKATAGDQGGQARNSAISDLVICFCI